MLFFQEASLLNYCQDGSVCSFLCFYYQHWLKQTHWATIREKNKCIWYVQVLEMKSPRFCVTNACVLCLVKSLASFEEKGERDAVCFMGTGYVLIKRWAKTCTEGFILERGFPLLNIFFFRFSFFSQRNTWNKLNQFVRHCCVAFLLPHFQELDS